MYNIIIDPAIRSEETTIWADDYVTSIKGSLPEVCKEIADRVLVNKQTSTGYKTIQVKTVAIDVGCGGTMWIDYLNNLGVTVHEIKPKHLDVALPRLR